MKNSSTPTGLKPVTCRILPDTSDAFYNFNFILGVTSILLADRKHNYTNIFNHNCKLK